MSDTRLVESADSCGEVSPVLIALADTEGMKGPQRANFWLRKIAKAIHRGPGIDTWTSARDDAAELAGITPSMAERIWHERNSKSVDGDALLSLMVLYEKFFGEYDRLCEKNERAAAKYRSLRLGAEMRENAKTGDKPRQPGRGMDAIEDSRAA